MDTTGELELSDILHQLGLTVAEAKVVVCLSKGGRMASRDIERKADLRQPEVSLALKTMRQMGWVNQKTTETKRKGRGRSILIYEMQVSMWAVVSQLERGVINEYNRKQQLVEKAKSMALV